LKHGSSLLILALVLALILPSVGVFHSVYASNVLNVSPSSGPPGGQEVNLSFGLDSTSSSTTITITGGPDDVSMTLTFPPQAEANYIPNVQIPPLPAGTYTITVTGLTGESSSVKGTYVVTDESSAFPFGVQIIITSPQLTTPFTSPQTFGGSGVLALTQSLDLDPNPPQHFTYQSDDYSTSNTVTLDLQALNGANANPVQALAFNTWPTTGTCTGGGFSCLQVKFTYSGSVSCQANGGSVCFSSATDLVTVTNLPPNCIPSATQLCSFTLYNPPQQSSFCISDGCSQTTTVGSPIQQVINLGAACLKINCGPSMNLELSVLIVAKVETGLPSLGCTVSPSCDANSQLSVSSEPFLSSTDSGLTVGTSAADLANSEIVFPTPVFPFGSILMMVTTLGALGAFWFFKSRRPFNVARN